MQDENEIKKLLTEIRDAQHEHLEEYRRVTQQSLDLQQRGVSKQEQLGKTYRIALIASAILITGIVALIMYLLSYLPPKYR